jgi:hypothetical protein
MKIKKVKYPNKKGPKPKYTSIIGSRSRMQTRTNNEYSTNTKRKMAKDRIIEYVAKFIKTKHYPNEIEGDCKRSEYDEMINNLKEFLQYLEDKNIINPKQLEDEKEVNNLISDILKLDLTKFRGNSETGRKSGKRSGSQNNSKDKELKHNVSHKRTGSERMSTKGGKRLREARNSDTPNAENLVGRRIHTSKESKRTVTIEQIKSQHSSRRKNPSIEERKSTTSSANNSGIPSTKHRRAIPSLEK